ncbi:unnamed protein product, partial [Rotaria sp. Silwood1]
VNVNEEIEIPSSNDRYRIMDDHNNNQKRRSSDEIALLNNDDNDDDNDETAITIDVRRNVSARKKVERNTESKTWLLKKWSHFDRM